MGLGFYLGFKIESCQREGGERGRGERVIRTCDRLFLNNSPNSRMFSRVCFNYKANTKDTLEKWGQVRPRTCDNTKNLFLLLYLFHKIIK